MRGLHRISVALGAALALGVVAGPDAARAQFVEAEPAPESKPAPQAVVVTIGEVGTSYQLREVIGELLERQGVVPRFESSPSFAPGVWLDQGLADPSTYVFVRLKDSHRAQLYFRGPHGQRFLTRELQLRDGLDELGRELIARVVETAIVALLYSSEGMSREEARAVLDPEDAPRPEQPPPRAELPRPVQSQAPVSRKPIPQRTRALLGLRVLGQFAGEDLGPSGSLGLEAGATLREPGWPLLRARLSADVSLPHTIDQRQVEARLFSVPLRAGFDVGTRFGLFLGLSTGVDVSHLDPVSAGDSGLTLSEASAELIPTSRAELRYELTLSQPLWLSFGALVDVPWKTIHYDVIEDGRRNHLATPWMLQPGLALTLGLEP